MSAIIRRSRREKGTVGWSPTWRERIFGIQNRIILPFLTITVLVAIVGTYVVTRLVAGSLQERLTNQLIESSRVASDGVVRQERDYLEQSRLIALANGVDTAIEEEDIAFLQLLVESITLNAGIPYAAIVDNRGTPLFVQGELPQTQNYRQFEAIERVLDGISDTRGDKYAEITYNNEPPIFYIASPITNNQGQLVGALLLGTSVNELLTTLKREALADVALYDADSRLVATTFFLSDEDANKLDVATSWVPQRLQQLRANPESDTLEVELNQRAYQGIYTPLIVRNEDYGLLHVYLPSDFVVIEGGTSAQIFAFLFAVAALLIIVLGLLIASSIVAPVNHLVRVAQDVTQGNLKRRAKLNSRDEIGFLGFTFDVMTHRLEIRNRQLETESIRLRSILAASQTGMLMVSKTGDLQFMNSSATRFLQPPSKQDAEYMAGRYLRELAPHDRLEINNQILDTFTTRVYDEQDEYIGTLIAFNDITRDEQARRLRDRFVAHVSHELRTPLTRIKGHSDIINMRIEMGQTPDPSHFESIAHETIELDQMIVELLSVSQMNAGTFSLRRNDMDLRATVMDAIQSILPRIDDNDLELETHIHADPCPMRGDAQRLSWAFFHILDNAVKYTEQGGKITCQMSGNLDGFYHLVVSDTGVGIRDIDRPYVFDAYFRRQAINSRGEEIDPRGIGIGLYIVKQVVEAHQGKVSLESAVNKGTTVFLKIPV